MEEYDFSNIFINYVWRVLCRKLSFFEYYVLFVDMDKECLILYILDDLLEIVELFVNDG